MCESRERVRGPDTLENHTLYGFLYKSAIGPPPPGKVGPPLKKLDPTETLENNSFL